MNAQWDAVDNRFEVNGQALQTYDEVELVGQPGSIAGTVLLIWDRRARSKH